ncbi:DUF4232 domain-containing protein [Streptomyces sp. NPDC053499]|uniref:DUF4232 domain-containing protein n=1 Tax=Streptomyces sp. NPDC053499 TaxID=3365707 RepID=UPI0037D20BF4
MTRKLTRAVRCTAAVLAVVAVGAGATACSSSTDASSSKAGTHADAAKGSSGAEAKGSSGVKVKKAAQKGSRTDAVNTSSAAGSSKRCHTGELDFTWGGPHGGAPDMDADHQQIATVQLKNDSGRTCTLRGFPGVQLVSKSGETWDLRRSADTPSTITLDPGESTAAVSMNILPVPSDMKGPKLFVPSKVLITPPNETTHVTLDWPYGGAILDQSSATRPGTFVNPVVLG